MHKSIAVPVGALAMLAALLFTFAAPAQAAGLNDLLGTQKVDESERKATVERIESIQEKLKLLQEKLRVLERRKAEKEAAAQGGTPGGAVPAEANWLPVDETTVNPGEAGLYTYLLFAGEATDGSAIGALEDLILTVETLPASGLPAELANGFRVPLEKPQSLVNLGRRPYDFKLSAAYLRRLGLEGMLPGGPVLVSSASPIDPYAVGDAPPFVAVSLGRQEPQRVLALCRAWHGLEKDEAADAGRQLAGVLWAVLDGAGPAQVARSGGRTLVVLPRP